MKPVFNLRALILPAIILVLVVFFIARCGNCNGDKQPSNKEILKPVTDGEKVLRDSITKLDKAIKLFSERQEKLAKELAEAQLIIAEKNSRISILAKDGATSHKLYLQAIAYKDVPAALSQCDTCYKKLKEISILNEDIGLQLYKSNRSIGELKDTNDSTKKTLNKEISLLTNQNTLCKTALSALDKKQSKTARRNELWVYAVTGFDTTGIKNVGALASFNTKKNISFIGGVHASKTIDGIKFSGTAGVGIKISFRKR